jgi:hypothetical protein
MIEAAKSIIPKHPTVNRHSRIVDISGRKSGRLTVLEYRGKSKNGTSLWLCRCECGKEMIVLRSHLFGNGTKSCGCLVVEKFVEMRKARVSHGHAYRGKWSQEFRAWHAMKCRCHLACMKGYKNYGGRGIQVCERWNGRLSFLDFLSDLGLKPSPQHSLDRINNDGNYSCGKCRQCKSMGWSLNVKWSTKLEQDNNRRICKFFSYNGETLTIAQWARKIGVTSATMGKRISTWPLEMALTRPPSTQNKHCRLNFDPANIAPLATSP